jgi:hypothetical protein
MSERSRAEAGLDRLAELRARAIEKYGIKDDDQRADMLASLMLAHERMTEAIAAGGLRKPDRRPGKAEQGKGKGDRAGEQSQRSAAAIQGHR